MTDTQLRTAALNDFAEATGVDGLSKIVQHGRDPDTARFTIVMDDGRETRVTAKTFFSKTALSRAFGVALGLPIKPLTYKQWDGLTSDLIRNVIDVEELADEDLPSTLRDWLEAYAAGATTDHQEAAAQRLPFIRDGELHVAVDGLVKFIRREYSEQIARSDLRQALRDLGFERTLVMYVRGGRNNGGKRTSASYYHTPLDTLGGE